MIYSLNNYANLLFDKLLNAFRCLCWYLVTVSGILLNVLLRITYDTAGEKCYVKVSTFTEYELSPIDDGLAQNPKGNC